MAGSFATNAVIYGIGGDVKLPESAGEGVVETCAVSAEFSRPEFEIGVNTRLSDTVTGPPPLPAVITSVDGSTHVPIKSVPRFAGHVLPRVDEHVKRELNCVEVILFCVPANF